MKINSIRVDSHIYIFTEMHKKTEQYGISVATEKLWTPVPPVWPMFDVFAVVNFERMPKMGLLPTLGDVTKAVPINTRTMVKALGALGFPKVTQVIDQTAIWAYQNRRARLEEITQVCTILQNAFQLLEDRTDPEEVADLAFP